MKQINLYYGHINQTTIDANMHPEEQLKYLREFIRNSNTNVVDIYCNSPYVLFDITLMEAYTNKNIAEENKGNYKGISVTNKHFEVKEDGEIIEGKYYKSMISDENLLNDMLGKSNDNFSDLLDLEDRLNIINGK